MFDRLVFVAILSQSDQPQTLRCNDAQVAELVDALASGASDRKVVEVRVLSWAPVFSQNAYISNTYRSHD